MSTPIDAEEPYHATVTLEIDFPGTATARDVQEVLSTAASLAGVELGIKAADSSGYVAIDSGRAAGTRVRYRVSQ